MAEITTDSLIDDNSSLEHFMAWVRSMTGGSPLKDEVTNKEVRRPFHLLAQDFLRLLLGVLYCIVEYADR